MARRKGGDGGQGATFVSLQWRWESFCSARGPGHTHTGSGVTPVTRRHPSRQLRHAAPVIVVTPRNQQHNSRFLCSPSRTAILSTLLQRKQSRIRHSTPSNKHQNKVAAIIIHALYLSPLAAQRDAVTRDRHARERDAVRKRKKEQAAQHRSASCPHAASTKDSVPGLLHRAVQVHLLKMHGIIVPPLPSCILVFFS